MTRNFLEGARKERMSYTPKGLCRAWKNLDAASKVYVLTVLGLIISVSCFSCSFQRLDADKDSLSLPLSSTLAHAGSTPVTASLGPWLVSWSAAKALNGFHHSSCSSSGQHWLAHGSFGRFDTFRTFTRGHGKPGWPSLQGMCYGILV